MKKRILSWLLVLALALSLAVSAFAASDSALEQTLSASAAEILKTVQAPQAGSVGGEWAVLGLARSGYDVPQGYWDDYYAAVVDYVKACKGVLHEKKYTEYSRLILALTAIGADPRDVAGYDLVAPLGDYDKTVWQGLNGPIWALIALDSGNYDMPVNEAARTQATRQMYVDIILDRQLADGGWSLNGEGESPSDPDITGMALQALAKYQDQQAVAAAIDRALACMSAQQEADGGIYGSRPANSESCVQMLVALCELGISLDDPRFVKAGHTLLDALMGFAAKSGGFLHTTEGSGNSQMASEQGLYALAAVRRAAEGKSSLYRMDDVTIRVSGVERPEIGLPGKHADVREMPVTAPGTTFPDISGHKNQEAVEAMAARGILSGRDDGLFDPNATVTRAEFAVMVTRSLGLTPKADGTFSDVTAGAWYAPFVGTAHTYGILAGKGNGRFDPDGAITRQEAAVMTACAAQLCGMDTDMEAAAVLDTLSQFPDYVTVAQWAREDAAFCYRENILDQSDLNVEPVRPILRCEVAQMLFNLLSSAKLL